MGVKDKIIVWIRKIHFPLVEVGLKEQIPLVIIWVTLEVDPTVVDKLPPPSIISSD